MIIPTTKKPDFYKKVGFLSSQLYLTGNEIERIEEGAIVRAERDLALDWEWFARFDLPQY